MSSEPLPQKEEERGFNPKEMADQTQIFDKNYDKISHGKKSKQGSRKNEKGELLEKDQQTDACHKYAAKFVKQVYKEERENGDLTIEESNEIAEWSLSNANLRIGKRKDNLEIHRDQCENEYQKALENPNYTISYRAMQRMINTMDASLKNSTLSDRLKKKLIEKFKDVSQLNKQGEKRNILERKVEETNLNSKKSKESPIIQNLNTHKKGVIITKDGNVDMRSKEVRDGSLKFTKDGNIDKRSKSVRRGDVILTQEGDIDMRSSSVRGKYEVTKKTIKSLPPSSHAPRKTSSNDAKKKTAPKSSTPKKAVPKKTIQNKAAPKSSTPKKTTSRTYSSSRTNSSSYSSGGGGGKTYVSGYTRSNGTKVSGYYRK